jgi:hypothetical protein
MTSITQLAWFYLFMLWSALTLAFIAPRSWTVLGRFYAESLALRGAEWGSRVILFGFIGALFDSATWVKPHSATTEPAFYLAYLTICIVITLPALAYYFVVTNRLK